MNGHYLYYLKGLAAILLIGLLLYACANRGYPEGGPKDSTPPKVIAEQPFSYSADFNKKRAYIYFDEYVSLKDINEKFIISPPMKKKPKVREKGKYIQIDFSDTLRPNTTYSLDFADAIVDLNEGNPLGFYRYVFSTGKGVDSLELSGGLVNAESGEPVLNTYIFLYENHQDSVPVLQLPNYVARTDSSGFFRLTNLKDTSYRIVAVEDNNRDYKFTPEGEMVAFLDSVVRPVAIPMMRTDTLILIDKIVGRDTVTRDSFVTTGYIAYGPNNLYLRLFQEEITQLYMVNDDRKERERLEFIFSIPGKNDFSIRLKDSVAAAAAGNNWYINEHSAGNDTISIWITDSTMYKQDTLTFIMDYLRSDSTGRHVPFSDTTRYVFKEKKKTEGRKKKNEEEAPVPMQFLGITTNASGDFDLNNQVQLVFDRPINKEGLKHIQLLQKVDTLYQPMEFSLTEDSLKFRQVKIRAPLMAEKEYMLKIDSATIYDVYGRHNNKLERTFKMRTPEFYGKVLLSVKGVGGNVILQMYKSDNAKSENGKRKYAVVSERKINKDGIAEFDFLHEGKYKVRAILDANGNGKWDTGLYLKGIQPEEIIYLPVELVVKQNFDIEQDFDLQKTYKD